MREYTEEELAAVPRMPITPARVDFIALQSRSALKEWRRDILARQKGSKHGR